jgi:hypothetical protein
VKEIGINTYDVVVVRIEEMEAADEKGIKGYEGEAQYDKPSLQKGRGVLMHRVPRFGLF